MCFVVRGKDGRLEEKFELVIIFIWTGEFRQTERKVDYVKNVRHFEFIALWMCRVTNVNNRLLAAKRVSGARVHSGSENRKSEIRVLFDVYKIMPLCLCKVPNPETLSRLLPAPESSLAGCTPRSA